MSEIKIDNKNDRFFEIYKLGKISSFTAGILIQILNLKAHEVSWRENFSDRHIFTGQYGP